MTDELGIEIAEEILPLSCIPAYFPPFWLRRGRRSSVTAETTRWGVLSTARINDLVLAAAAKSERVRMLAVASRDSARADAYARERGFERSYGSYDALLADPDVEAVYISVPNDPHVEWSVRALDAGKHVLCEKPLTATSPRPRRFRRRRAARAGADGGVHVAAPSTDADG